MAALMRARGAPPVKQEQQPGPKPPFVKTENEKKKKGEKIAAPVREEAKESEQPVRKKTKKEKREVAPSAPPVLPRPPSPLPSPPPPPPPPPPLPKDEPPVLRRMTTDEVDAALGAQPTPAPLRAVRRIVEQVMEEMARTMTAKELAFAEESLSGEQKRAVLEKSEEAKRELLRRLPCHSFTFHSELMREAGQYRSPLRPELTVSSPPCEYEDNCVAMQDQLAGFDDVRPGCILMAQMTPDELYAHFTTGETPQNRRPCVLCARHKLTRAVKTLSNSRLIVPGGACVQPFYVQNDDVRRPGVFVGAGASSFCANIGYDTEACLHPRPLYNGLVAPVPAYDKSKLFAYVDEKTGLFRIDQSAMRARLDLFRQGGAAPRV
jgi:hypothetical protein